MGLDDCDVEEVTKFLEHRIPHIVLENVISLDITYRLPVQDVHKFTKLFNSLERNLEKLKLSSFGVNAPTLGETFLKISGNNFVRKRTERSLQMADGKRY